MLVAVKPAVNVVAPLTVPPVKVVPPPAPPYSTIFIGATPIPLTPEFAKGGLFGVVN